MHLTPSALLTGQIAPRLRHAVVCLCLLLASAASSTPVCAQVLAATGPVDWNSLAAPERSVLWQLRDDWRTISPAQQQKWIEIARRFPALPLDEKVRVQHRLAEWSRLSPQERASARFNFQEARQLSPQERQQQWEAYQALPAEQRRALAERAGRPAPSGSALREPHATVKSSVVRTPAPLRGQPVSPSVVKRGAGVSTDLVSRPASPPMHQQAGLPKVAATPGFVDKATLLPQRGAQGAAARPPNRDGEKSDKPEKPNKAQ